MSGTTLFASSGLPQVDIATALPELPETTGHVFVRLWGRPLGLVEVNRALSPATLAATIWGRFGHLVQRALIDGGLSPVATLTADGLAGDHEPSWLAERQRLATTGEPVSVIVCTRDRPELLDRALHSLGALDYHDCEIIVVDNAPSTNATQDVVAEHIERGTAVRYLREPRPGLSWARNAGLAAVTRSYVAYTDDDAMVDANWLSELMRGFAAAPLVGCVTGQVLPHSLATDVDRWRESYAGAAKLGFQRRVFDLASGGSSALYPFTVGECGFGMNMAFRTDVLRSFGGFETALGAGTRTGGGEDLAAFFEVIRRNWRLVYEPGALICHVHRTTYPDLRAQMRTWGRGLTAYLTHTVAHHPVEAAGMLVRGAAGLRTAMSPHSAKNATKPPDYPAELTATELIGLPEGPFAYLGARRDKRRLARGLGL